MFCFSEIKPSVNGPSVANRLTHASSKTLTVSVFPTTSTTIVYHTPVESRAEVSASFIFHYVCGGLAGALIHMNENVKARYVR